MEKKEKKEKPIKGSARGPRGPEKKPGYLVGERVDHNGQVKRSIQITNT